MGYLTGRPGNLGPGSGSKTPEKMEAFYPKQGKSQVISGKYMGRRWAQMKTK
jgi:hypothetical protein